MGYVYFYIDQNSPYVQMVSNITTFAQYFYASFHIFILYFSNKQFANKIKEIILKINGNRFTGSVSKISPTNANNLVSNIQTINVYNN